MVDTVDLLEPTLLPDEAKFTNGNVVTVAAGKKHSVFVMQDGTVYTCGRAMTNLTLDLSLLEALVTWILRTRML